jgi:hypothetical protein
LCKFLDSEAWDLLIGNLIGKFVEKLIAKKVRNCLELSLN